MNEYQQRFLHPALNEDNVDCKGKGLAEFSFDKEHQTYHFGKTLATPSNNTNLPEGNTFDLFVPLKKKRLVSGRFYGETYYLRPQNRFYIVVHTDRYVYLLKESNAMLTLPAMNTIAPCTVPNESIIKTIWRNTVWFFKRLF